MVAYLLDFHENIRFSRTLTKYQEQPYSLLYFLIYLKNALTFVGYLSSNQGIFIYPIFPEHYVGIFPGISQGTFSEYSENISWECSTNTPRTIFSEHYLGIFPGISLQTFSEYSGNLSWEYSTNIPRTYTWPVGIDLGFRFQNCKHFLEYFGFCLLNTVYTKKQYQELLFICLFSKLQQQK